jgi:hypothetical protein
MSPEIGQAATRIALFMIIGAGLTLLLVPRGSAEFVVLILTICMGLIMLGIVALFARLGTAPRWDKARSKGSGSRGPLDGPPTGAHAQDEPEDETEIEGR